MGPVWHRTFTRLRASPALRHGILFSRSHRSQPNFLVPKGTVTILGHSTSHFPRRSYFRQAIVATGAIITLVATAYLAAPQDAYAEAPGKEDVKYFRLAEVKAHDRNADTYWIIRGERVYDVTDWVPSHPGGDVILKGVGGVVDPFWKIFSIHNKPEVYDILEQYFIGLVDPRDLVDGKVPQDAIEDPFKNDPKRDERLVTHTDRPCNAETPEQLLETYITPNNLFYVRNHFWVPDTKGDEHRLTVEMDDGEVVVYTVEELKRRFKPHTVTAILQCSGNRRSHMTKEAFRTNGLQWSIGAIGNAEWTGVRLRDVLKDAGLDVDNPPEDVKHAVFQGAEAYGASIPIDKATDRRGDVLLAYEMNGEPLPHDHGYPLRVIVPGNVAARSVKWLNKVSLSEEESTSQWQRRDYKCFGPNEGSKPDWDRAVSIQEMPVQSAITSIRNINCLGEMSAEDHKMLQVFGLEEDCVKVEGYAYSGGGRKIVRVDVSADNGHTWNQAELLEASPRGSRSWSWQRWRFGISQGKVGSWFLVKAVDDSYNSQSQDYMSQYNYRGNLTSAWHRVPYKRGE